MVPSVPHQIILAHHTMFFTQLCHWIWSKKFQWLFSHPQCLSHLSAMLKNEIFLINTELSHNRSVKGFCNSSTGRMTDRYYLWRISRIKKSNIQPRDNGICISLSISLFYRKLIDCLGEERRDSGEKYFRSWFQDLEIIQKWFRGILIWKKINFQNCKLVQNSIVCW